MGHLCMALCVARPTITLPWPSQPGVGQWLAFGVRAYVYYNHTTTILVCSLFQNSYIIYIEKYTGKIFQFAVVCFRNHWVLIFRVSSSLSATGALFYSELWAKTPRVALQWVALALCHELQLVPPTVVVNWRRSLYSYTTEQPPTVTLLCTVAKLVLGWTIAECPL